MKDAVDYLIEHFGAMRLTTSDLARILNLSPGEIRNQISAETFPIKLYKDHPENPRAPWYADVRDVAAYLDSKRPKKDAA